MTIHELLAAAGLTANDEIPIWDADGTGEPTKKITAQQLAAAVVALAAVAKTGDTMTGPLNIRNDLTSYDLEFIPPVGANNGGFIDFAYGGASVDNTSRIIEDQWGVLNINGIPFNRANPFIGVQYGGTGATTPAGARANLEITLANIGIIVETIQIQFPANQNYVYVGHKSGYNLVQAMTTSNDSNTYINGIVDSHSVGWWTLFVGNPPTSTATYSMKLCWVKE